MSLHSSSSFSNRSTTSSTHSAVAAVARREEEAAERAAVAEQVARITQAELAVACVVEAAHQAVAKVQEAAAAALRAEADAGEQEDYDAWADVDAGAATIVALRRGADDRGGCDTNRHGRLGWTQTHAGPACSM
jgi:hypothetical protein